MHNAVLTFVLLLFPATAAAQVQPGGELAVADAAIAVAVVNRQPQGVAQTFAPDVGRLYCWTRVTGAVGETQVEHVWYWGDQEMARVPLRIGSPNWRTWSRKNILPEWTGSWRVDVVGPDGTVLRSIPFTVQSR